MEGDLKVDPEGKNFHDCMWTTAVSGAAGVRNVLVVGLR